MNKREAIESLKVPGRVYVRWSGNYWWDVVELPKHRVVLHCGTQDIAKLHAGRINKAFRPWQMVRLQHKCGKWRRVGR